MATDRKVKLESLPLDTPRHPALGQAPMDMTEGHPGAAALLRGNAGAIAEAALQVTLNDDPSFASRYDQHELRRLVRDARLLVERLADSVSSGQSVLMSEYAEWVTPLYRRRRVSLADLAAICEGICKTIENRLGPDEEAAAGSALDAAIGTLRCNARLSGDTHRRDALSRWTYRGV